MRIVAIEPTPNPNSMKLTLDEALPEGSSLHFGREEADRAPTYVQRLLAVDGVKSLFHVANFMALERFPQADWQRILAGVRQVFEAGAAEPLSAEPAGRVNVFVQFFRGLPMQIKLVAGLREVRVALPERFKEAAMRAAAASPDVLAERRWVARGARYGELEEVGREVAAEVSAAYDEERLARLTEQALRQERPEEVAPAEPLPPAEVAERLRDPDWRRRYAALEQLEPEAGALDVVVQALADPNPSVRRLATVYLGQIGEGVLPHLIRMLRDGSPAVRRAAGDCLSDLGDPGAIGAMCEALRDPSRLVRWRAARYLYEVGDESALPALRAAAADPEFEVRLQAQMAVERIEGGHGAVEPAWKQLTRLWEEPER
ncbi:MAG: virulence factor [Bacillota bacterium]